MKTIQLDENHLTLTVYDSHCFALVSVGDILTFQLSIERKHPTCNVMHVKVCTVHVHV